jgi:hypothetical protein
LKVATKRDELLPHFLGKEYNQSRVLCCDFTKTSHLRRERCDSYRWRQFNLRREEQFES